MDKHREDFEFRIVNNITNSTDTTITGDIGLLYSDHETLPLKDFNEEVRSELDVRNFLNDVPVQLDISDLDVHNLLKRLLEPILSDEGASSDIDQAIRQCYADENEQKLGRTIQGTFTTADGRLLLDQSWLTVMCTLPSLKSRHVAAARLLHPLNLGPTSQEVHFIFLVIAPTKEKGTKNALETGRTFATLLSDASLRLELCRATSSDAFKQAVVNCSKRLGSGGNEAPGKGSSEPGRARKKCAAYFGWSIMDDLKRRIPFYTSDIVDGFVGDKTLQKTISTTIFLYFAILLPSIALGMLNDTNTHGSLNVRKVIISQTIGGLIFAILGGQPMTILMTTAPLALFTKVIYTLSKDWNSDFFATYALVGIWNAIFLIIYAVFNAAQLMKWSTRSTEEIFAIFIAVAFVKDSITDLIKNFNAHYHSCDGTASGVGSSLLNVTTPPLHDDMVTACQPDTSLLFLLLMLGTFWLGVTLFNFTKTPFLNASKRELLADYALPVAVLIMSLVGSWILRKVQLDSFKYDSGEKLFTIANLGQLPFPAKFGCMGLGFCLSLLFFMDQNISSAMVASPSHKLKKGQAYSWDLLVVALLNAGLAVSGLPMLHGALPHSPLHVQVMAEVEEYVEQGHVYQRIVKARETRVTGVLTHVLIGVSTLLLPYPLSYIPRPVLDGLFLYLAVTSLTNNQFFERLMLIITEQTAYPPTHYIRRVPQKIMHFFTFTQLLQLGVMCGFGFAPFPYMKMCFPILLLLALPIRHGLVPALVNAKYLDIIDAH